MTLKGSQYKIPLKEKEHTFKGKWRRFSRKDVKLTLRDQMERPYSLRNLIQHNRKIPEKKIYIDAELLY